MGIDEKISNLMLFKRKKWGKENKMATQVVHIVYVSCALLNNNLLVPYLVLSFIHT